MSKYSLGDNVFMVHAEQIEKYATCPDCQGKRFLTVIMGDDSRVTIPCTGCSRGYEESTGIVHYSHFQAEILCLPIISVKIEGDTFEYDLQSYGGGYYPRKESEVFATREEAEEHAKILIAEKNQKEIDGIKTKYKDTRSWAWHATYYRREVKSLQEQAEYYSKRLDWANQVKKEKAS